MRYLSIGEKEMLTTKTIATNYTLDILDVQDFKSYYYDNKDKFTTTAMNNFLKAVDIPPKFFKEQPESTQDILLDNREYFVAERKKFIGKVIIVLKSNDEILNACRLSKAEAEEKYEALNAIDEIKNKFEHRSFVKDGYTTFVISDNIKRNEENKVLVVDFPLLLNKKPVIYKATYEIPNETFATQVEHIHYLESVEVELGVDYTNIVDAIKDNMDFLTEYYEVKEAEDILREIELVTLALVELKIIPKSLVTKVQKHVKENVKGTLNTWKLEKLVLDFEEELRKYKQVTNLRSVSGEGVFQFLNSDTFKALAEELAKENESLVTL